MALFWRTALATALGVSSCASDCGSTKRYTAFDATSFAATPSGMVVRVEKQAVTDTGWERGESRALLETTDLRATNDGLVRIEGDLAHEALANGNRFDGSRLLTATGQVVSSLDTDAPCAPLSSLGAVAPDRRSVGVLRACSGAMAGTWTLTLATDAGARLADLRITPPSSARFETASFAVANDHESAISFFGTGLHVRVDGTTNALAKLPGTLVGAVGASWVTQEGSRGNVYFHFFARDGRELRRVEVAGLEEIHIGTAPGSAKAGAKDADVATTGPVKLFADRLFVVKTRPPLPLPVDGENVSRHIVQQYGFDGALLREDPVAF